MRGSSPTQFSVCLGQTVSGFSAWWCASTAHFNISPEGKAFALTLNSYITIVLIKNMDSCFTEGLLQGIKREHFSTLCIWSDSTWQASQGIWMLFSSEELAQGASSTGTGRLKPIPHTGIPRNSEPTWCLKHIPDFPYSVYVSYGREVSNHKILHTQLFIQECARLTTDQQQMTVLFPAPCAWSHSHIHVYVSLFSSRLNHTYPGNEIHRWILSHVRSYFFLFVF